MAEPGIKATPSQILVTMAAFVIVVAGMKSASAIIVPFLLAVFIAIISTPFLLWLEKRGLPKWLALIVVIVVVVGIGTLITGMLGTSLRDFSGKLPQYTERLNGYVNTVETWLGHLGLPFDVRDIRGFIDAGKVMKLAGEVFNSFGGVLTNSFLIFLTVLFILFEASSFPIKLRAVVDNPERSLEQLSRVTENIQRYLAIKTLTSLGTGLFIALALWIIGVDNPVLWGMLAFMLNYVPNIGSVIAAVPAMLLALLQLGVGGAIATASAFLVVNVVIGSFIEPRFMGRGLGLSALVVFLSLVFWGWVLGLVGMFLSVPLTMAVKIALDGNEQTQWIATFLGPAQAARAAMTGATTEGSGERSDDA